MSMPTIKINGRIQVSSGFLKLKYWSSLFPPNRVMLSPTAHWDASPAYRLRCLFEELRIDFGDWCLNCPRRFFTHAAFAVEGNRAVDFQFGYMNIAVYGGLSV